jgi:hypothetical protein
LGRKLGNTYAGISVVNTVVTLAMIGEGIGIELIVVGSIYRLIYPILTLVLLNTTFKEDLIN